MVNNIPNATNVITPYYGIQMKDSNRLSFTVTGILWAVLRLFKRAVITFVCNGNKIVKNKNLKQWERFPKLSFMMVYFMQMM